MHYLTVGELADQAGVTKVAIRYYERCGLLPKATRLSSGYRAYPEIIINRLRFIKNAKSVGFTLEEIQELIALQEQPNATSQDIKSRTTIKLGIIQEKIQSLQQMANTLEQLVQSCDGQGTLHQCPILETLYKKTVR
ncbi:MAG: heavy metal-responsive transcriptional regulator [Coxiellaceae bacterium]|nr:MAG: heavy metal-responsive transcriptional regulator [Coxiellaceae bacterium]